MPLDNEDLEQLERLESLEIVGTDVEVLLKQARSKLEQAYRTMEEMPSIEDIVDPYRVKISALLFDLNEIGRTFNEAIAEKMQEVQK